MTSLTLQKTNTQAFGGFSERQVDSRGRVETIIDDEHVADASRRIIASGVLDLIAGWEHEDNPEPGRGGQPPHFDYHAILVGLMLLAGEGSPMWLRNLNRLFYRRLTPESRTFLQLPTPVASFGIAVREEKRWEKNVNNNFHRMLRSMDPYPMKRHSGLMYVQIEEVLAAHDPVRAEVALARLNQFTTALLLMTYREQPRRIRRISKQLDVSIDQTSIHSPTKAKGYSPKRLEEKAQEERLAIENDDLDRMKELSRNYTADPWAGFYPKRSEDRSDLTPGTRDMTSPKRGTGVNYVWGWALNVAMRVDSEQPQGNRFPQIAMAATMSMPNVGVSEEAVELLRLCASTELAPGVVVGDKQYFANALPERLHNPVISMGWTPSTDYRKDRLGPQGKEGELGSKGGVEFIEGTRLCPGTPKSSKMASVDHVNGLIDDHTYRTRIKERLAFQVHAKERPDAKGRQPVSCPARGNSPTLTCPVYELLMKRKGKPLPKVADKVRPRVEDEDAPEFEHLPKICRQHSVSLRKEDDIRTAQKFPYMSREWEEFQQHARNSIESLNGHSKDGGQEGIDTQGRRLVRGFGPTNVIIAVQLTQFNLRTIATFLKEEEARKQEDNVHEPPVPIKRRRDRLFKNFYTGTLPDDPALLLYSKGKLNSPLRT